MLGETLQREPFREGDKGSTARKNGFLSRGVKDEKRELDQEGRDRLTCTFCTILSPLDNFKLCHKLTFYILVSCNVNFIIIISRAY